MSVTKIENGWSAKGTVCLPDGTRRHYNRKFKTKREAVAFERERREELQHESPSMTLDAFVKQQDERDRLRVKESTLDLRAKRYRTQIQPAFGHMKLNKITVPMVERWYTDICSRYAINTTLNTIGLLSTYLAAAVRMELIPSNPCTKVRKMYKDPNKVEEAPENYWAKDEFLQFKTLCPDFRHMDQLDLLWATGMRIGECIALQWKDFDGRSINIRQSYAGKIHKITSPKTANSVRKIALDDKTVAMLKRRKEVMETAPDFSEEWFVFGGWKHQGAETFRLAFIGRQEKCPDLKRITVHGLRHSHAALLIDAGVNDFLIADRLGHTVQMLHKVYAHLYDERRESLTETLNQIL